MLPVDIWTLRSVTAEQHRYYSLETELQADWTCVKNQFGLLYNLKRLHCWITTIAIELWYNGFTALKIFLWCHRNAHHGMINWKRRKWLKSYTERLMYPRAITGKGENRRLAGHYCSDWSNNLLGKAVLQNIAKTRSAWKRHFTSPQGFYLSLRKALFSIARHVQPCCWVACSLLTFLVDSLAQWTKVLYIWNHTNRLCLDYLYCDSIGLDLFWKSEICSYSYLTTIFKPTS